MALGAGHAEASLVLVFMAGKAVGGKSHERVVQVLATEKCALRSRDVLRGVAGAAGDRGVLPVQHIAGLAVVKALGSGVPMQHVEIFAVVVRVAFDAGSAGRSTLGERGVQTVVILDFRGDFGVALCAAKRGGTRGHGVALSAVGRAIEPLMGLGERAGRDLCTHRYGSEEKTEQKERAKPTCELCRGMSCWSCHPNSERKLPRQWNAHLRHSVLLS